MTSTARLCWLVGKNCLPVDDQSQFEINVRAPEGNTLSATTVLTERIAADVRKLPGVTDTLVTIGAGQQQVVNLATIYVNLAPTHHPPTPPHDLMLPPRSKSAHS